MRAGLELKVGQERREMSIVSVEQEYMDRMSIFEKTVRFFRVNGDGIDDDSKNGHDFKKAVA